MNWDQFKKRVGCRYQFQPPACNLDEQGNDLPERDDDWILQSVSPAGVATLQNVSSQHLAVFGKDHLYDFRSNPGRSTGELEYGFLVLKVQVFIQGSRVTLKPNSRPGEPVVRARRVQPIWTPWLRVVSQGMPPVLTAKAQIQFRLWSDDPAVPLMLRVASTPEGGYMQEVSGPSGVVEVLILEPQTYYFCVSHPNVRHEVSVTGFEMRR